MRLSPEDEHVSFYGRRIHPKSGAAAATAGGGGGQILLKTWSGNFSYAADDHTHHQQHQPNAGINAAIGNNNNEQGAAGATTTTSNSTPYPRLPVRKLTKALEENQWEIESIQISHVQLLGSMADFVALASYLKQSQTLKTVLLSDAITSPLLATAAATADDDHGANDSVVLVSGFDTIVRALAQPPNLQEVSLQNMHSLSQETLGHLCRSTSLVKLQLLVSQSMLQSTGGCLTGAMIQPLARQLSCHYSLNQTNNNNTRTTKLQELRIFGVLDYDACHAISEMLLQNTSILKMALKVKIIKPLPVAGADGTGDSKHNPPPSATTTTHLPLLSVLGSPHCSLTSLELYLSGSRPQDVEHYAARFGAAMQVNPSIQHLNLVVYGGGGGANISAGTGFLDSSILGRQRFVCHIMDRLVDTLRRNYVLEHVLINHGLVELSDAVKMYLRLNRAGRRRLLDDGSTAATASSSSATTRKVVDRGTAELDLWVETLGRVRNDLSCLYYFLSCHPTLFCDVQDHHRRACLVTSSRRDALDDECDMLPLKRKLSLSPCRVSRS